MPQRFQNEGYHMTAAGKLFHGPENRKYLPNYAGDFGGFGPLPEKKLTPFPGQRLWDWGDFPDRDEKMPDHKLRIHRILTRPASSAHNTAQCSAS